MANTLSRTDALARIKELQAEADQLAKEADEKAAAFNGKLAEIRDVIDGLGGAGGNGHITSPTAPVATANSTRPAVKKAAVKKPGRPGRKPSNSGATATATAQAPKKRQQRGARGGENEKTLREVIWDLHSQSPRQWKKVIPDIPNDAKGLKAVECAKIIDTLGLWKSPTGEVSNQISGHYMNFRKEGKMRRGDQVRYEIVPGATLDGPSLDENGKPIKE